MRQFRTVPITVALVLTLSLSVQASLRIRPHKHVAQKTSTPYEPKPDTAQPGANTDTPAAKEQPVQTVSETSSSRPADGTSGMKTSGAATNGTSVQAIKGSTLLLNGISGQTLNEVAMQYLGRPYRSGASGPSAFDCSGFTSYVYRCLNISLSRSSREQYHEGVPVPRGSLCVGDLVFFARGGRSNGINHVGMVCEVLPDGNFKFVHACSRGVSIDNYGTAAYYQSRYVGARRILAN